MPDLKISIILPIYNPTAGWADIVLSKSAELMSHYPDSDFEFILVDDGSAPDLFREGYQTFNKSYIKILAYKPNKGKGHALRTGVAASTGELIVYTDIDFPYTIASICSVIDILKNKEADVVVGVKDSNYYMHVPSVRRLISRLLRMLIRLFFRIPTDDTQCGLKGFNLKAKPIFLQTTVDRYLFDLEFVSLASKAKDIVVKTQEVKLREEMLFHKMNFGILRNEFVNFLKILIR